MTRTETGHIWGSLVEVNRFGSLSWKDPGLRTIYGDSDPREYPEKYIVMSGSQRFWDSGVKHKFNIPKLNPISIGEYESPDGVNTGVIGLLQLSKAFSLPNDPNNITLVGAITDKSLMCTLEWVHHNAWCSTNTTLVDKSPVSLKHIEQLKKLGFFEGAPDFDIVQSDITKYEPSKKQSIVISDLTNVWAVPRYSSFYNDPYGHYSDMVSWASSNLSSDGVYFTRCVVYPEFNNNTNLNYKFDQSSTERAHFVKNQLVGMQNELNNLNYEDLESSMTRLFENVYPASQCCLNGLYSEFTQHPTLEGEEAEKVMRRIHHDHFSKVEEIKVLDLKSGATYLNFACQN